MISSFKTENGLSVHWSRRTDGPMNLIGREFPFTERPGEPRRIGDRERLANRALFLKTLKIEPENTAVPKLVHGDVRKYVSEHNPYVESVTGDAVITDVPGFVLTIGFGDCPPVVLFDPEAKVLALVHGGWKPLSLDILEKTIGDMWSIGNAHASRMTAFIGPSIRKCCYEVGPDVASKVDGLPHQGSVMLSLPDIITARLVARGVPKENIHADLDCTKCAVDKKTLNPLYFSFRRDKKSDPLDTNMLVASFK